MKKYRVTGTAMIYIDQFVDAESQDHAIEKVMVNRDIDDPDPNLEAEEIEVY
jgi:hypothetical protein